MSFCEFRDKDWSSQQHHLFNFANIPFSSFNKLKIKIKLFQDTERKRLMLLVLISFHFFYWLSLLYSIFHSLSHMSSLTSVDITTLTYRELHPSTPGQNVPQVYEITHSPFQRKFSRFCITCSLTEYSSKEEHKRTLGHPDASGLQRTQSVQDLMPKHQKKEVLHHQIHLLRLAFNYSMSWKQIKLYQMSTKKPLNKSLQHRHGCSVMNTTLYTSMMTFAGFWYTHLCMWCCGISVVLSHIKNLHLFKRFSMSKLKRKHFRIQKEHITFWNHWSF